MFCCIMRAGLLLLVSITTYAQDLVNDKDTPVKEVGEAPIVLEPLGRSVLPSVTFRSYRGRPVNQGIAVWKNRLGKESESYKVSLIAVNMNTWLENPKYFRVLKDLARKFPVNSLLDNLQTYNPDFVFNDPSVVREALNTDIYTPYLQHISNYKPVSLQFSDIKETISYTRRYHIYGASAGDLPYFGRPVEGGQREINLGIVSGQIQEAVTKLPETEVFLVAMVNVIPNWLEETIDIFQVNQQKLEILVYAFDRRGKMIGGAGVPQKFFHEGREFIVTQQITSKIWQPSVSREFYILPSYQIANTYTCKEKETVSIDPPIDRRPVLTRLQKTVLHAVNQLRAEGKKENVKLFNNEGKLLLPKQKVKPERADLLDRTIRHRDSTLLVDLTYEPLFAKFQDSSANENIHKKVMLTAKRFPSNEGDKLIALLIDIGKALVSSPYTNDVVSYTNKVLPYDLKIDPVEYRIMKKQYYLIDRSMKALKKESDDAIHSFLKDKNRTLKEKIFWHQELVNAGGASQKEFNIWKKDVLLREKLQHELYKLEQKHDFFKKNTNKFQEFVERNRSFIQDKYANNPEKLEKSLQKLEGLTNKLRVYYDTVSEKDTEKITTLKSNIVEAERAEKESYALYRQSYSSIENLEITENDLLDLNYQSLSSANDVPESVIKYVISQGKRSPEIKYRVKAQKRKEYEEWKERRISEYDGFMLGITDSWKVKTTLQDRLDYL